MLQVSNITAGYGISQVLFEVSLTVQDGEVVALLGRNGMGKSTTLLSIAGIVKPAIGSIVFSGTPITGREPFDIARRGISLVPEGRHIFPNLTVRENLIATEAPARSGFQAWTYERVLELFPRLADRRENYGNQLSGGEQQMLAIGRALMTNPKLLILDEATEGLAPLIREEIWKCLRRLRSSGLGILVVDKNIKNLLALVDRHYIVDRGRVVWQGSSAELSKARDIQHQFLAV